MRKTKNSARRLNAEHDRVQQEVSGKTQQALWLAESMLEGVQAGLKEESKNAKEEYAKQLETLDDLERQADELIISYRQTPPSDVAIPIETIEGKPDDALQASQQQAERKLAELKSLSLPHLVRRHQAVHHRVARLRPRGARLAAVRIGARSIPPARPI